MEACFEISKHIEKNTLNWYHFTNQFKLMLVFVLQNSQRGSKSFPRKKYPKSEDQRLVDPTPHDAPRDCTWCYQIWLSGYSPDDEDQPTYAGPPCHSRSAVLPFLNQWGLLLRNYMIYIYDHTGSRGGKVILGLWINYRIYTCQPVSK